MPTVPASAAGITLAINPSQQTVVSGTSTLLDITISGLGDRTAPSLSAWDLDLHFDPALLSVENSQFGGSSAPYDQLDLSGLGTAHGTAQPSAGDLHLYEVSFDSPSMLDTKQQGSFILAEITLRGTQPGISQLSLSIDSLGDSMGNPLTATTVSGANIQITPSVATPEPGSIILLAGGILILFAICRGGFIAKFGRQASWIR